MTTTFALITEGITDQVVLAAILQGHYRASECEVEVVPVQPARDQTDISRQGAFAGWEKVLEACNSPDVIRAALAFNDYLIVQIDTDVGQEVNFGLALTHEGVALDTDTLVASARALIQQRFSALWNDVADRVVFAICVHSLECWLLVEHGQAGRNAETLNCFDRLGTALTRDNRVLRKDYACYQDLARPFRKPRVIKEVARVDASFRAFVDTLPQLQA